MKRTFAGLILAVWLAVPSLAMADWFGIGDVATAIGGAAEAGFDAKVKLAAIAAAKDSLGAIILLVCIVGAIVSATVAGYLTLRLFGTARTALQDQKLSMPERVVLGGMTAITLPVVGGLLAFAGFLALASRSGLLELMG